MTINPIVMPKWGLAMQEGLLAAWHVTEGATVAKGQELADIETSKIANVFESPAAGTLRRRVATEGETLPVGALLAVLAEPAVADAEIEAFVADFQSRFAAQAIETVASPEPAFAETTSGRLRYLKMGDAPGLPFVLIHGFGGDLNSWMFNQPALAERRTTYALDLPGHGGSTKTVGKGSVGSLTGAVCAFLDEVGIGRAHLVGHSLGGAVALDMALDHGERVASATLIAPGGLGPDINLEYIDGFIATSRAKKLRAVLEMLVADPALISGDMVEEVLRYKRLDGVDAALNTIAAACFAGGRQALVLAGKLDAITAPLLVIWGREDRILPAAHAQGLPAHVRVTVLEGIGHLAHMEKAADVNALLLGHAGG